MEVVRLVSGFTLNAEVTDYGHGDITRPRATEPEKLPQSQLDSNQRLVYFRDTTHNMA
jgi:hypothetical protein